MLRLGPCAFRVDGESSRGGPRGSFRSRINAVAETDARRLPLARVHRHGTAREGGVGRLHGLPLRGSDCSNRTVRRVR